MSNKSDFLLVLIKYSPKTYQEEKIWNPKKKSLLGQEKRFYWMKFENIGKWPKSVNQLINEQPLKKFLKNDVTRRVKIFIIATCSLSHCWMLSFHRNRPRRRIERSLGLKNSSFCHHQIGTLVVRADIWLVSEKKTLISQSFTK